MKITPTLNAFILSAALIMLPLTAKAAKWQVDYDNSSIGIIALVNGIAAEGKFKSFSAEIDFDPENPAAAHIAVTVDLTSATMKDPQQTTTLAGKDWFDTAHFPKATFTSTTVKATGNNTFEISATLTLKDKTLPIVLPFTFSTTNNKAHATGKLTLLRNQFNVGQGQFSSGKFIGFEVELTVDITANSAD